MLPRCQWGLVAQRGVPPDSAVFAVPVGQLDAHTQQLGERGDLQELVALT